MAESKRKTTHLTKDNRGKKKGKKNKKDERRGPRLPSSLRREVDSVNPNPVNHSTNEDDSDVEEDLLANDVYEYDEPIPEEESKRNRRYDPVDNLEYELPEEFEDEDLSSGDDSDSEEDRDGKHRRMVEGITGMPQGNKRKFAVVMEAYPEAEYNPSGSSLGNDGRITVQDLLVPLQEKSGYSKIRKRMRGLERGSLAVQTPVSKLVRENMDRKVVYENITKKDLTKYELQVKSNRQSSTITFDEDTNIGFSTVGAIAFDFKPRTEFEKKMDLLVHDPKVVEAYREDGARILELNKVSIEDVKDRQDRLAKMRSFLFRHELKAKHVKKIKSKTYHRLMNKDKKKAAYTDILTDPEAAKEQARKQEFKRAEERMTLQHKNKSKWARRIMERGLKAQDEGTRVAITEQLHQHALLTRKMNSMKDSSSDDDSSDEDDEDELSPGTEQDGDSKLLTMAIEKTIKVMAEEDEMPTSGVHSLPFMVRGLKKREEEAHAEAKLALEEYKSSLQQLEDTDEDGTPKTGITTGRRVFGVAKKQPVQSESRIKSNNIDRDTDSEDEYKDKYNVDTELAVKSASQKEVHVDANMFKEGPEICSESVYKSFEDTVRDPGTKTSYEVAIFASNSKKKIGSKHVINAKDKDSQVVVEPTLPDQDQEENEDGYTESEEETVDGFLSSGTKTDYELPSQADLIRRAFAGDDVEGDFEEEKQEVLNEENPEPEKPLLLPGWGQWTKIQKKRGMPSWMREEHESAKKKREDGLKQRKDAHLKHVIISERINKKEEKLHTKTLPFPFTSKEVFEQSIRVPIGPDFNTATSVQALICPEVVKKPGIIIKPIKFEEVNHHNKDEHTSRGQNPKKKNDKSSTGKATKKMKKKQK